MRRSAERTHAGSNEAVRRHGPGLCVLAAKVELMFYRSAAAHSVALSKQRQPMLTIVFGGVETILLSSRPPSLEARLFQDAQRAPSIRNSSPRLHDGRWTQVLRRRQHVQEPV